MTRNLEPLGGDDQPVPAAAPQEPRTIDATVLGSWTFEARPILPAWLRNRDDFVAACRWARKYGGHAAALHTTHSPLYVARLVWRVPRGLWRVTRAVFGWVFDSEQAPLRADAVRRNATNEYMTLSKQRNTRVRQRGTLVLVALVVAVVVGWVFVALAIPELHAIVIVLLVGLLGKAGTPPDRRVLDPVTVTPYAPPRLEPTSVIRALRALGISEMNKKDAVISFPHPVRQDGPGWRADVDLPYGVTPQDVMEKRAELASGLRRPLGCVWPEPARDEHAGRLVLWVGMQDLAKTKQPAWPLAKAGRADLFAPLPFGTDQRGRTVSVTLMFANMVIGSIPRVGKTFALRLLLLAAALDVLAELHVYDLKGTGDLSALGEVAHAYRAGDDEDDIEYAVADMRALAAELRRRTKVIRTLPKDLCPESKITPELAGNRALGLHPIVVGVDECQRWFEHGTYGKELTAIAEDLVRRGPAVGIIAVFATQRPDAKSLPTGISGNAILRFCLKVMDHTANDMVLGTSSHKNGIKATMFSRNDRGIGWLAGEADDPQITRTFYVDNPGAEAVCARARVMREKAGTLTGYALGEDEVPLTAAASLLEDMRIVFAHAEVVKVSSETALELLAAIRPEVYTGWTPEALAAGLKPFGVTPGQVWIDGENRRGYKLDQVTEALAQHALGETERAEIEVGES